jgi:hypothetical protein
VVQGEVELGIPEMREKVIQIFSVQITSTRTVVSMLDEMEMEARDTMLTKVVRPMGLAENL